MYHLNFSLQFNQLIGNIRILKLILLVLSFNENKIS